jgi:hypothetical protein
MIGMVDEAKEQSELEFVDVPQFRALAGDKKQIEKARDQDWNFDKY